MLHEIANLCEQFLLASDHVHVRSESMYLETKTDKADGQSNHHQSPAVFRRSS